MAAEALPFKDDAISSWSRGISGIASCGSNTDTWVNGSSTVSLSSGSASAGTVDATWPLVEEEEEAEDDDVVAKPAVPDAWPV